MSQNCRCVASRLFPHRVDRCSLKLKSKKKGSASAAAEADNADQSSLPPLPPATEGESSNHEDAYVHASDFEVVNNTEFSPPTDGIDPAESTRVEVEEPTDASVPEQEDPIVDVSNLEGPLSDEGTESNSTLPNGAEQCDCVAYRTLPHRKNKCSWKKHAAIGLAVGAAMGAVVVAAVVLANQSDSFNQGTDDRETDLSAGINGLNLGQGQPAIPVTVTRHEEEEERVRVERETTRETAEREEAARLAAERDRVEAAALLRAEIREQERRFRAQQAQLEQQQRGNERLRQEAEEARTSQQHFTYNQSMYQTNNTQQNTYTSSIYNVPTYNIRSSGGGGRSQVGTTLRGTPCKNCLKQGVRCHQHR